MKDKQAFWIVLTLLLTLVTLPYAYAFRQEGVDYFFSGFLFNPLDGNSYLAKMFQGQEGMWRFRLPYTAQPGNGAYLFLFYIALGHLARIFHQPLILVYHLSRLGGAVFLVWMLWRYFSSVFPHAFTRNLAFTLAALGSGMGWLALPFGGFTADFWVAEAYPFLSSFANPHFPLGLGLLLALVQDPLDAVKGWGPVLRLVVCALALSVISPFGVLLALAILGGTWLYKVTTHRQAGGVLQRALLVALGGIPLLVYDVWAVRSDPILAAWNAQNQTPSPPLWDTMLSFSPLLVLAVPAIWERVRSRRASQVDALVVWVLLGFFLMYLPVGLQRRFMMGMVVPLAGLAAYSHSSWVRLHAQRNRFALAALVVLLALPTNLIILSAAWYGVQTHDPQIYLTREEAQALKWVRENTPTEAVILASPEMGAFIPAQTGRRVVYGHPFETADAEAERARVEAYFSGKMSAAEAQAFLQGKQVAYLFLGPRERLLGMATPPEGWALVYQTGEVMILARADG